MLCPTDRLPCADFLRQVVPLFVGSLDIDPPPAASLDGPPRWSITQVLASKHEHDFLPPFEVQETGAWWSDMPEMRWAESRPSELRHVESLLPLLSLGVLGGVHPPAATECLMQLVLRAALCERGWGPEQEPLLESVFVRAIYSWCSWQQLWCSLCTLQVKLAFNKSSVLAHLLPKLAELCGHESSAARGLAVLLFQVIELCSSCC